MTDRVEPLIHGRAYFDRLAADVSAMSSGDGPRPPGRLRPHRSEQLGRLTRLWAERLYRAVYDPDGRSYRDRFRRRW